MSPSPAALLRWFRTALLCGAAAMSATAADKRERKDVFIPPPQPVPQEIKVERGQDITVPLRIYGQRNQQLIFLIRKQPRHGLVGSLRHTSVNTATVEYRPPADRSIHSDVFEYAVKSTEGVSASVTVQIEITDRPPDLFGPAEVLFPPQLTGTREVQTIELTNRGGMTAQGGATVDPPWRLESPEEYRAEPGARIFVKVAFEPQKAGDFLGEVRLSSQPDRSVVLRGIAQDALAVRPAALTLTLEPTTLVRAGVFEVTNNTPTEQVVRVTADPRIHCEPELRLARGQTAPVMIRTHAADSAALTAQLTLETGPHRTIVPVNAAALPAIFRAGERAIDLGFVPGGTPGAGQLTLRNVGGTTGWAMISVRAPFRVGTQRVDLAPGASTVVPIFLDGSGTGAVEQPIQVRTAGGTFSIPARATVLAPGAAPPRISRPASEPSDVARPRREPLPLSPRELDASKPDPTQLVRIVGSEPTRCTLEWHAELSSAAAFAADQRELRMRAGQLAVEWKPLPRFRTERSGSRVRGTLDGLEPGHRYTVRVIELAADQQRGPQIFLTSFELPSGEKRGGKFSLAGLLSLLAVGLGGFAWWRRARPSKIPTRTLKKTQRIA